MPTVATLLRKHKELHRRSIEIEQELAEIERQMRDAERQPKERRSRSTKAEMLAVVRDTVKLLRDAGPLPRREIAERLGISPHAASYRLKKAMELKFVERTAMGLYRCTAGVIPFNA